MKLKNNITGKYQALSEEMLSKRQVVFIHFTLLNDRFPYPFYIPQLVKSRPFYIPEAWKGTPFGQSLPVFNNFSLIRKWRWIVVDIYRGKYPPLSPTLRWIIVLVAELQRAKHASEAPWVRKNGNPSSRENLVLTSAYVRPSARRPYRLWGRRRGVSRCHQLILGHAVLDYSIYRWY